MTLARVTIDGPMPIQPAMTVLSRPFWDALSAGNWVQSYCNNCNTWKFPPPAQRCPTCYGVMGWRTAPTMGSLHADTTIHAAPPPFADRTPYHIGLVDLANGVRMLTPLLAMPAAPEIDDQVELVRVDYEDGFGYACRIVHDPP